MMAAKTRKMKIMRMKMRKLSLQSTTKSILSSIIHHLTSMISLGETQMTQISKKMNTTKKKKMKRGA